MGFIGTFLIILCTILWATDAVFRMPLVQAIDASTIILVEHVVCVLATFPMFYLRRAETRALGSRGWLSLAFVGVMGSAVGTYLFTSSFRHINPSVSILLQKIQPIFAVVAARLFLGEQPRRGFYYWAALALLASVMVSLPELWSLDEVKNVFPSLRVDQSGRNQGIMMAVGAAFCWGLSTVFGKWITGRVSYPVTSFLRFAFGLTGIGLLVSLAAYQSQAPLTGLLIYVHAAPETVLSLLYMALIPGVLAMYLYYAGLKRTKASVATFAELFFPVASIAINWTVLGQSLVAVQIIGTTLLLIAVFFINVKTK